jgi:bifunctional UDP-N-acetylglucosamine pyrophosphorylase/glucosamine-1-phosphate N-acetyltransferase
MRSHLPKVLQRTMGRSLLGHVLEACRGLGPVTVIVGHQGAQVQAAFAEEPLTWVTQAEQKGTGHALQQLLPLWSDYLGKVLVLTGDAPLVTKGTLEQLIQSGSGLLTAQVENPTGYGRVFCEGGYVHAIVEEKDCTPAQRQHPIINGGIYCFSWPDLAPLLAKLTCNNKQGEYYLTEVFNYLSGVLALATEDPSEVLGVNDRLQLSQVGQILNQRILRHWLREGVSIVDLNNTTIEATVELSPDVLIEPGSHLKGHTFVATGATIGPGTLIENSRIGANSEILYSVVRDSQIGTRVMVGPYAHLRGNSMIGNDCRIGNFDELKNSQLESDTKCGHLSYLGDSTLGTGVNIGAGTITANFDGYRTHPTVIGDRVKTGANSVLVAPVTIGAGTNIAAGSTITEDVPPHSLAIARSRQVVKTNWKPRHLRPETENPE